MRTTLKHRLLLSIIFCLIGITLLVIYITDNNNERRYSVYNDRSVIDRKETCYRNSTIERLLEMIETSDKTFSLFGFDGPLERIDLLCWMYQTQMASKRGLKANSSECIQSLIETKRNLVPRNAFYVVYGKYTFSLLNYMSILSIRRVIPNVNIYIVGDQTPIGIWWEKVLKDVKDIRIVYRKTLHTVFNQFIKLNEHVSDIVRLQILMLSGGIYVDPDILFLRPIENFLRPTTTMGLIDEYTGVGNGLIFTKRHSKFLEYWYESYENFDNDIWGFHSMKIPIYLSKIYPQHINLDTEHMYKPSWFELEKLFGQVVPWENNVVVHMWTRHSYPIPSTLQEIDSSNTTAGEMLRYVYYKDKQLRTNETVKKT